MKNKITSLLLFSLFIQSTVQGQLQKGQWLFMSQIGGHKFYTESPPTNPSSFYSQSDKLYKPGGSLNYFFAKSSSVGIGGIYNFVETESYSNNAFGGGSSRSVDLTRGTAGQLHFNQYFKVSSNFLLYVGLVFSYQKSNHYINYYQNDRETHYEKFYLDRTSTGVNMGMMYVFNNRIAIQLNVSGFERYTLITKPENKSYKSIQNEWNTQLNNGLLSVGLCYFIRKAK